MKKTMDHVVKMLILGCALTAGAAHAQSTKNQTIKHAKPGAYGQLDVSNYTRPFNFNLVSNEAISFAKPGSEVKSVVYMHVNPKHIEKWKRHCNSYKACNTPVFFVTDEFAREFHMNNKRFAPRYTPGAAPGSHTPL